MSYIRALFCFLLLVLSYAILVWEPQSSVQVLFVGLKILFNLYTLWSSLPLTLYRTALILIFQVHFLVPPSLCGHVLLTKRLIWHRNRRHWEWYKNQMFWLINLEKYCTTIYFCLCPKYDIFSVEFEQEIIFFVIISN